MLPGFSLLQSQWLVTIHMHFCHMLFHCVFVHFFFTSAIPCQLLVSTTINIHMLLIFWMHYYKSCYGETVWLAWGSLMLCAPGLRRHKHTTCMYRWISTAAENITTYHTWTIFQEVTDTFKHHGSFLNNIDSGSMSIHVDRLDCQSGLLWYHVIAKSVHTRDVDGMPAYVNVMFVSFVFLHYWRWAPIRSSIHTTCLRAPLLTCVHLCNDVMFAYVLTSC